jgi:hypothetical protein
MLQALFSLAKFHSVHGKDAGLADIVAKHAGAVVDAVTNEGRNDKRNSMMRLSRIPGRIFPQAKAPSTNRMHHHIKVGKESRDQIPPRL